VLAKDLDVSRNTVLTAFEQLLAEGYVEGKIGSGTCVASRLPDDLLQTRIPCSKGAGRIGSVVLSKRGEAILKTRLTASRFTSGPHPFRPHLPALDQFPVRTWSQLTSRFWKRNNHPALLGYGSAAGYEPLRKEIASYATAARAVRCHPDQVVIVNGSQQGLDLAARILLDPGDQACIEEPGYFGARGAFVAAGAQIVPIPVDEEGIDVAACAARATRARVVYVTPSHQYPLGVTMSLRRRLALIEWAAQSGAWIIEDDYDSEYRYGGRPIASLQGLDTAGRTIYIGTFSKVLAPALCIGYLILPAGLVNAFSAARRLTCWHSPLIDQAVLSQFLAQGHFSRHVRRMRLLYETRQRVLTDAVSRHLSTTVHIVPSPSGMTVLARLNGDQDDVEFSARAAEENIDLIPISPYYIGKPRIRGFLLGFAALKPAVIRDAVRRLAKVLAQ